MRSHGRDRRARIAGGRVFALVACLAGWVVLGVAIVAPLAGMALAAVESDRIQTDILGTPTAWEVARRSLILSATATLVALGLGILPAAVLGHCSRRQWPWVVGLVLAPLIVPPQVYAYAWSLLDAQLVRQLGPNDPVAWAASAEVGQRWAGGAVRAGLISGGWLWPVVALVLAAGYRSTGRAVYRLALLDASSLQAFVRAVLPSLRPQIAAAAALVAGITLIEYAIPHLTLCRAWATELMVLVDVRAPAGQVIRTAAQPIGAVALILAVTLLAMRGSAFWQPLGEEDTTPEALARLNTARTGLGLFAWAGAAVVWLATLGVPVVLMACNLRVPGAWLQGLATFAAQWADSLQIAAAAGLSSVLLAVGTVGLWYASGRRVWYWAALATLAAAVIPPPALGVGYVVVFNRPGWIGDLYADRPVVWIAALVGRYGVVAVLILWLSLGRRKIVAVEQARVDGGNGLDILRHVLVPMLWPALVSAGLIVTLLALFEVVITQLTRPPAYGSIAMTILNYMHYGRDDAVITTTLTLVAFGVVLAQACAHLLMLRERQS